MKIADTEFNLITDIRTLEIQYSGKMPIGKMSNILCN
jgi:hypothetical protein